MNIAIIGANGFIGKHLVDSLSKNSQNDLFLFGRSEDYLSNSNLNYKKIDLFNSIQNSEYFKNIDFIYYLVSASIPSSTWENPSLEIENNLIPFITFLECITKLSVKKIVFISSAGTIYGSSEQELTENSNKKPFSPYGINKVTMEYYLNYFEVKYNLKYSIFRVSNIYGEGQDTSKGLGIINTFLEKIILENSVTVFGNGSVIRNYIYVKDVAKIIANSINSDLEKSEIYNLSSNDSFSINELIDILKLNLNENFSVIYIGTRESDNPKILLDNTKLTTEFINLEFTPFQEGIYNTYLELKKKINL